MRGGSIIDATIIAAPSSTKNASSTPRPGDASDEEGQPVGAGTGYAHTVTAAAANVHDLEEAPNLVRADDETVYADYGYQGAAKRPEITEHEHLSKIEWRIAARKGALKTMSDHDRAIESRQAAVRAKVEYPFLIAKRTSPSPRPATAGSRRTSTTSRCCSPRRTG
jgi:transposase, IS5 family